MFFNFAFWVLRIVFFPLYRLKVQGRENIPENGGMLICANHISLKDPIFVAFALGRKHAYAFMAKVELFQNPVLRFIMNNVGAFPVNRGKADIHAIKTALRSLKNGKTLIIFPEGTRISADAPEEADAKSGAGMLALRGGAPVVPVLVSGSTHFWGKVTVTIGKPFTVEQPETPDYKEIANNIMKRVRSLS